MRTGKDWHNRVIFGINNLTNKLNRSTKLINPVRLLQLIGRPPTMVLIWVIKQFAAFTTSLPPTTPIVSSLRFSKTRKARKKRQQLYHLKKQIKKGKKRSLTKITKALHKNQKLLKRFLKKCKKNVVETRLVLNQLGQVYKGFIKRLGGSAEVQAQILLERFFQLWSDTTEYINLLVTKFIQGLLLIKQQLHPSRVFQPVVTFLKIRLSLLNQALSALTALAKSLLAAAKQLVKTSNQLPRLKFRKSWFIGKKKLWLTGSKFVVVTSVVLALSLASYKFYSQTLIDLPSPTKLSTNQPALTSKIYDRNGHLLYKLYRQENRSLVTLDQIPEDLVKATIAIEDKDFFSHSGFSVKGILRATKSNLNHDQLQGGSTITQQLIKNTLLSSERTLERKLKELALSVATEFFYSKEEILQMYFNQVPYGGEAYGVEEASQMYFGKSVSELNLSESAYLAGLPAAPSKYSPYGAYPERAVQRQHQVLRRMVEDGYISLEQAQAAFSRELTIKSPTNPISAPHFVMYVRDQLSDQLNPSQVEQGGLEIHTSIDLDIQNQAEQILKEELEKLKNLRITNGAILVTKPSTGEILAMVGSRNYFDQNYDGQVNVTIRPRQPGSAIKPINYAMALENGLTPASTIPDTPICFNIAGQPPYCPKNYDNSFHGLVTLRTALANSYNIPAVKLLNLFGVDKLVNKGSQMGIASWQNSNHYGLSLTLGGGEVTMAELATAYGVFANSGYRVDLKPVLEVKDSQNKAVNLSKCGQNFGQMNNCGQVQVLDPRVAYQITSILSDNLARSQAFGLNSVLRIDGHQVAVKTGTTNSLRDNWTIGYTSDYLVAVWVGNNDNTPMSYVASGITGASPIWNKVMTYLLNSSQDQHAFVLPTNLTKVKICSHTGTLACGDCPTIEEYFIPGTEPTTRCSNEQIAAIKQTLTNN